jgi:hypothetical protein
MSWHVVERRAEQVVNLYCPECWDKAVNILQEFSTYLENKDNE